MAATSRPRPTTAPRTAGPSRARAPGRTRLPGGPRASNPRDPGRLPRSRAPLVTQATVESPTEPPPWADWRRLRAVEEVGVREFLRLCALVTVVTTVGI